MSPPSAVVASPDQLGVGNPLGEAADAAARVFNRPVEINLCIQTEHYILNDIFRINLGITRPVAFNKRNQVLIFPREKPG